MYWERRNYESIVIIKKLRIDKAAREIVFQQRYGYGRLGGYGGKMWREES